MIEGANMCDSLQSRVVAFSKALSVALYDKSVELEGRRIIYYCDNDVILPMVMGFLLDVPDGLSGTPIRHRLVRSLISQGFLGQIHLLRSHAHELHMSIRSCAQRFNLDGFGSRIREFLEQTNSTNVMDELYRVISTPRDSPETEIQVANDFLNTLIGCEAETFVAIEQLCGSWQQRLRRYWDSKLVMFDELGDRVADTVDQGGSDFDNIREYLCVTRPSSNKIKVNLVDALALMALALSVRRFNEGKIDTLVRFYSQTRVVVDSQKEKSIANLLIYKRPQAIKTKSSMETDLIFRDEAYFLMRVRFPELSFDKNENLSLDRLERLKGDLSEILMTPSELDEAVRSVKFQSEPLSEIIDKFESLTLMDSTWIGNKIPKIFFKDNRVKEHWKSVFEFSRTDSTLTRVLEENVLDIEETLEKKLSSVRSWLNDYSRVYKAAREKSISESVVLEDPIRDLGLIRWGITLSSSQIADVVESLSNLYEYNNVASQRAECVRLATKIENSRSDSETCKVVCSILWGLGLEQLPFIVNLIDQLKDSELPLCLRILSSAAKIKHGGDRKNEHSLMQKAKEVLDGYEKLLDAERWYYSLGIGYALYHIWKRIAIFYNWPNQRKAQALPKDVKALANQCYKVVYDNISYFPQDNDLARSFALNHCLYVSIQTGCFRKSSERFLLELIDLKGTSVWNHRFADTIGWYYTGKFKLSLKYLKNNPESREQIKKSKELGIFARMYLEEASRKSIGDIDSENHLADLRQQEEIFSDIQRRYKSRNRKSRKGKKTLR